MYHLQAPSGWMNDPCAPGFDAATGLFHLFFQWNPRRNPYGKVAWDHIAWGHATSRDLIHWTVSSNTSLKPGPWYDKEGCFTGCMWPTGVEGAPGQLTIFYTGVSRLPLHYSLPYIPQTETLAVAQSTDGGATWGKAVTNPLIPEPPKSVTVTGWRDPFIAPWPSIDHVLEREADPNRLYAVISGGVRGVSPTAFLYSLDRRNLTKWEYICPLVSLGLNHNISRWSGDMGINFECTTFLTGTAGDIRREFIIMGGEGSKSVQPDTTFAEYPQQATKMPRSERSLQWMSGTLQAVKMSDGRLVPSLEYKIGGRFDHGMLYAINTFTEPKTGKTIAWGWITEEDLPQKLVDRQGWSGLISLPREVGLVVLRHVEGALKSDLQSITSIETLPDDNGTFAVLTLQNAPAPHVKLLRKGRREIGAQGPSTPTSIDIQTCRFELDVTFEVSDTCFRIGLSIFHTPEQETSHATNVYLIISTETLIVERPDASHIDAGIYTQPEVAPFTLFTIRDDSGRHREKLRLRVFVDESVVEVFANDRCTISTRIYPATKRCWGVKLWAVDESSASALSPVVARAWDGLRADIKVSS